MNNVVQELGDRAVQSEHSPGNRDTRTLLENNRLLNKAADQLCRDDPFHADHIRRVLQGAANK